MRLHCERDARLSAFFGRERHDLALRFAEIATTIPRWRLGYENAVKSGQLDAYAAAEFEVYPAYLEKAFKSGDGIWLDLFVGEKIKQAHAVDGDFEAARAQITTVLHDELDYLAKRTTAVCGAMSAAVLMDALATVRSIVIRKTDRTLKILWIADCLYLDIQSFLAARLADAALSIEPDFVTTKDPVDRFEQVASRLQSSSYDAIFFCPFSYENDATYARLFHGATALTHWGRTQKLANESLSTIEPTIRLLSERSECPIFVHNASGVMRDGGRLKEAVKDVVTRVKRLAFCQSVNSHLGNLVAKLNDGKTVGQVIVIDEYALAKADGLRRAGRYFHKLGLQHPARLGFLLAPIYLDILVTIQSLLKKKVVVCDLDNTLWDGVVGEGAVVHYEARQTTLKSLRQKGVLLAINSKNNPDNVT